MLNKSRSRRKLSCSLRLGPFRKRPFFEWKRSEAIYFEGEKGRRSRLFSYAVSLLQREKTTEILKRESRRGWGRRKILFLPRRVDAFQDENYRPTDSVYSSTKRNYLSKGEGKIARDFGGMAVRARKVTFLGERANLERNFVCSGINLGKRNGGENIRGKEFFSASPTKPSYPDHQKGRQRDFSLMR